MSDHNSKLSVGVNVGSQHQDKGGHEERYGKGTSCTHLPPFDPVMEFAASCQPVVLAEVDGLAIRLKTCLHYYISSIPFGTLLCFLLLAIPLWASSHGSLVSAMLPWIVYCLSCLLLFSLAAPHVLQNVRALASQVRWYQADRSFATFTNAAYPLAVVGGLSFLFVSGPQQAIVVQTITWHVVLSCVLRDGLGTLLTLSRNLEDAA